MHSFRRTLIAVTACLVAVVVASVPQKADMAGEGPLSCADRFPENPRLAPWGHGKAEGPLLKEARAFGGDRHLGPLRWSSTHQTIVDAPMFGEARQGLVTLTAPVASFENPDYGGITPGGYATGALSTGDGRPVWSRGGDFTPYQGNPALLSKDGALARLDPATGTPRWCLAGNPPSPPGDRYPQLLLVDADGARVLSDPAHLSLIPRGSSAPVWRTPTLPFRSATMLGEYVLAGTHIGILPGAQGLSKPLGEFGVFRRSDGRRLWGSSDLARRYGVTGDRTLVGLVKDTLLIASGADLVACDVVTGRVRWIKPYHMRIHTSGSEPYESRPVPNFGLAASRVLVGEPGTVRALKLTDGSVAWSARTGLDLLLDRGQEYGGRFYAAGAKGTLVVIDMATGAVEQTLAEVPSLVPGPDIPITPSWDLTVVDDLLLFQHHNITLAFPLSRPRHERHSELPGALLGGA